MNKGIGILLFAAYAAFGQLPGNPERVFIETAKDGVIAAHLLTKDGRGPTFTATCESGIVDYRRFDVKNPKDCHLGDGITEREIKYEPGNFQDGTLRCFRSDKPGIIVMMQEKSGHWIVEYYKIQ
jgi:hypothetical protein